MIDSPASSDAPDGFESHSVYFGGQWIERSEMLLPIDDIGFRQGVIAVERLRTYQSIPFETELHLRRWVETTSALQIRELPGRDLLADLIDQLLDRNRSLVDQQSDVGITLFATPGQPAGSISGAPSDCTLGIHLNPLFHDRIQDLQGHGQPIICTDIQQPSDQCWPRSIKVRSRIHYYLADRQAKQTNPSAIGVLVDQDGSVTETSVANLAVVESGRILAPLPEQVLPGVTMNVVQRLAESLGISWQVHRLTPERVRGADEVLLMGTETGLWFANSVDKILVGGGSPGEVYLRLRAAFQNHTMY